VEKPLDVIQGRITDNSRLTSFGNMESIKRVAFYVGDHGPFYEEFSTAEFTIENVRAKLEATAAVIRGLYQPQR
jgi:hypothetical protein